jgi:hypothetical protein
MGGAIIHRTEEKSCPKRFGEDVIPVGVEAKLGDGDRVPEGAVARLSEERCRPFFAANEKERDPARDFGRPLQKQRQDFAARARKGELGDGGALAEEPIPRKARAVKARQKRRRRELGVAARRTA